MKQFINTLNHLKKHNKLTKTQIYISVFGILLFVALLATLPIINSQRQNISKSQAETNSINSAYVEESQNIKIWTEDPWIFTNGGTNIPSAEEINNSSWTIPMLRNEVEQKIIGIMNPTESQIDVRVTLETAENFKYGRADLRVLGAIESRASTASANKAALVNIFTKEQVESFNGNFPESFVDEEYWKDFPILHLKPNAPVRLWMRIQTYNTVPGTAQPPSGNYIFNIKASALTGSTLVKKNIDVEVLSTYLPTKPYKQVLTYGGYDEILDNSYYTTVNGSQTNFEQNKSYVYKNLLSYSRSGLWSEDLSITTNLYKSDPEGFKRKIRAAVDAYYARLNEEGWKDEQILISILDEPILEDVEGIGIIAQEVKSYRPDARIVENPAGNRLLETLKGLSPFVDIWIPHETMYRLEEHTAFLKSTGKPLWFYSNYYGEGARNEVSLLRFFRRAGWIAIKNDLQGMGMWGINFGYGDIWNDFDGDDRGAANLNDAVLIFPSNAGYILTRGIEAWRESVEDISMYERISQAKRQGKFVGEWETRASSWLSDSAEIAVKTFKTDPETVVRIRKEAWELLSFAYPAYTNPTNTPTPSPTPTNIPPTPTQNPTPSATPTPTPTPSPTPTNTPSPTPTVTPSPSPTFTPTPTVVPNGLTGKYYNNNNFTGTTITRVDPTINFNWGYNSPLSGIDQYTYSTVWTGYITPKYSEAYRIYFRTDDGARVYVNGVKLIDSWKTQPATEYSGTINLTKDQRYPIRIEYFQNYGGSEARLSWSSKSQVKQVVPQSQLLSR